MIALILAAALCAKFENYQPPAVAYAEWNKCGHEEDNMCDVHLAEKFANGEGVKRDYEIAEWFLCESEDRIAPAEFDGMMEHLQNMRAGREKAPLKFCDHVTSGYGSTYCANVEWQETMPKLEARLAALAKATKVKPQFDALRTRGEAYVTEESTRIGEQSRGGTGYSSILLHAEMSEKQSFVDTVEALTKKRAPAASDADAKAADAELNAAYRAVVKGIDEAAVEEPEVFGEWKTRLRDAQRAWIAYRDAFAAYYAERWKGSAPPDALRREAITHLTRKRTAELREEE